MHLYNKDEPHCKIIDVFICKIRKKLADATGGIVYIDTVWSLGYVLNEKENIHNANHITNHKSPKQISSEIYDGITNAKVKQQHARDKHKQSPGYNYLKEEEKKIINDEYSSSSSTDNKSSMELRLKILKKKKYFNHFLLILIG